MTLDELMDRLAALVWIDEGEGRGVEMYEVPLVHVTLDHESKRVILVSPRSTRLVQSSFETGQPR
jgi:hypothetical protein